MRQPSFTLIPLLLLILICPVGCWAGNDNQSRLLLSLADISTNFAGQDSKSDPSQPQNADQKLKVKNSVQSISKATNVQEQEAADECNVAIQRLCRQADDQIQELDEAMKESLAANRNGFYKRGQSVEFLNDAIKQDYTERIDTIKSNLSWKIDKVRAAYAEKDKALEDAASSMEESYVRGPSGNVLLIPDNSNIYVRNYQIDAVPTGLSVPIKAVPKKLLPKVQASKQ